MFKLIRSIASAGAVLAGAVLIVGCSSNESGNTKSQSVTDEIIDALVESTFTYARVDSADAARDAAFASDTDDAAGLGDDIEPRFFDVMIKDNIVYAAVEDGILTHNLSDGGTSLIPTEKPIGALIDLGDKILAGGDNLYVLDGGRLSGEDYQLDLPGAITALRQHGLNLLVGTTAGLYLFDFDGIRELASGLPVSVMTSDPTGVWIGTAGEGLYRWDGQSFRRRYLRRDSTLFDNVTAMQYNHNHLYLGTDHGFYVYDGGCWQSFGLADGLPSEMITAVNADDWVVKIGTARGPVTFFNGQFKLMPKLESVVVTEFVKVDNRLVAATTNAGLLMKSGGLVTTLSDGKSRVNPIAYEDEW